LPEEAIPEPGGKAIRQPKALALIEAALYVSGRPLDVATLRPIARAKTDEQVRNLARALMEKYKESHSAIEVLELSDGRYVMQLRPSFVNQVKRLATKQLLSPGPLRTLSFIAMKQPVSQAYVVRVRGKLTYSHVRQLREMGLIEEERLGRSKLLRTAPSFADYFNLSRDPKLMRKQLEHFFEATKKPSEQVASGPTSAQRISD